MAAGAHSRRESAEKQLQHLQAASDSVLSQLEETRQALSRTRPHRAEAPSRLAKLKPAQLQVQLMMLARRHCIRRTHCIMASLKAALCTARRHLLHAGALGRQGTVQLPPFCCSAPCTFGNVAHLCLHCVNGRKRLRQSPLGAVRGLPLPAVVTTWHRQTMPKQSASGSCNAH